MVKFTSKQIQKKGSMEMLVESEDIEKMCSFYVSDFHLEMILVPYLNKKIDNKEDIKIITEKNLQDSIKILISRMNMPEEKKQKILDLGWDKNENLLMKKSNFIIIGSEEYIKEKNKEIKQLNMPNLTIVDCYDFEEVKENINDIKSNYNNNLNTLGSNKF